MSNNASYNGLWLDEMERKTIWNHVYQVENYNVHKCNIVAVHTPDKVYSWDGQKSGRRVLMAHCKRCCDVRYLKTNLIYISNHFCDDSLGLLTYLQKMTIKTIFLLLTLAF